MLVLVSSSIMCSREKPLLVEVILVAGKTATFLLGPPWIQNMAHKLIQEIFVSWFLIISK